MIYNELNLQVKCMITPAEGEGFEPTDHGWDHDQRFQASAPIAR
jgi:hypothetical protein